MGMTTTSLPTPSQMAMSSISQLVFLGIIQPNHVSKLGRKHKNCPKKAEENDEEGNEKEKLLAVQGADGKTQATQLK